MENKVNPLATNSSTFASTLLKMKQRAFQQIFI